MCARCWILVLVLSVVTGGMIFKFIISGSGLASEVATDSFHRNRRLKPRKTQISLGLANGVDTFKTIFSFLQLRIISNSPPICWALGFWGGDQLRWYEICLKC